VSECQVGIGSVVSAAVGPFAKRFGGRVAFGATALRYVVAYRATRIAVSYDGSSWVSLPLLGLAVGNGSVCAGGMQLTPDARLDDGQLDVLAIHAMGVGRRLRSFPLIYAGTHVQSPRFQVRRTTELRVAASSPTPVSADGEPLGVTPCRITLFPRALRIRGAGSPRS
jgi:diacylglycerol kinase (ATP)